MLKLPGFVEGTYLNRNGGKKCSVGEEASKFLIRRKHSRLQLNLNPHIFIPTEAKASFQPHGSEEKTSPKKPVSQSNPSLVIYPAFAPMF